MRLTSKQLEYVRDAHRRWNIAEGAVRSGKSWLATAYTIPDRVTALAGKPGINLLLGVSLGNIERNVLVPMRERFGDAMVSGIKGASNTCQLFGETVYCLGAEKRNQVSKLKGAEVKFCYCDELADISPDVFEMLKSRLSLEYSECHAACNPESPQHWLKRFIDTPGLDIYDQRYQITDNPHLPTKYVEELKREYAGTVYYDRFILGKWVLAEGLVYANFDRATMCRELDPATVQGARHVLAIDYGITNPFAALDVVLHEGAAYVVDEYYFDSRKEGRRKTDEEHYRDIREWLGNRYVDLCVIDPSASSFIETIARHGEWDCVKADNDVLDGIANVSTALNTGCLFVSPRCGNLLEELGLYRWDSGAPTDRVVKEHDHACLVGSTLVETEGGAVPIAELVGKSGRVWGIKDGCPGLFEFEECACTGAREVFEVELADGRTVRATGDHPFLTERGWVRCDRLTADDAILDISQSIGERRATTSARTSTADGATAVRVAGIRPLGTERVYNMTVRDAHCFAVEGGLVTHNCDALRYYVRTVGRAELPCFAW